MNDLAEKEDIYEAVTVLTAATERQETAGKNFFFFLSKNERSATAKPHGAIKSVRSALLASKRIQTKCTTRFNPACALRHRRNPFIIRLAVGMAAIAIQVSQH